MKTHDLKIWPSFYDAIMRGEKGFELRRDDRGFGVNDTLLLREYDPSAEQYTGNETRVNVIYIIKHVKGLEPGYCIMGIE